MNGDLLPAVIAAGGGAVLGAIHLHEQKQTAAMRASRLRLGVRFPADLAADGPLAVLRAIGGLDYRQEVVLEVHARPGVVGHVIAVPAVCRSAVENALAASLPGVRLEEAEPLPGRATVSLKLFVPTPVVLHDGDADHASRTLLTLLSRLVDGEQVVVRWALSSGRPRVWEPSAEVLDRETTARVRAWQQKTSGAGVRVAGLVLVRACSVRRARELGEQVVSVFRARTQRHGTLRVTTERSARLLAAEPRVSRSSGWLTTGELLPLLGWPVGVDYLPGLERGGARERLVPAGIPGAGRVLFVGRDLQGERPVALSPEAARHHMAAIGPSGSGKSVLIGRSILDDIASGAAGVVVDPKADLIDDVLNRIPEEHADRIVVLDPADSRPVPGVAVFGTGDPDLQTDVLVGALAAMHKDSFGIRSQLYLRLGLRTLADVPGATIADLAPLFFDSGFRSRALKRLTDPVLLAQWQAFESLSPTAQAEHVQSPMAKVSALLSRPAVRAVLAAPKATLDIPALLADGRWLFISLSPGRLGEPASKLLGAVLLYSVWSAIEGRAALPPQKRTPIYLYIDELSTIASLPFGLELLLERARGLGAGVVVALQSIARLPEQVRVALLGNAATLITFRAGADQAKLLARELPGLEARDVQALGRYEVAARLGMGAGSEIATVTGRTLGWPEKTGLAEHIRNASSARYSAPADEVPDAEVVDDEESDGLVGRSRRRS
jgi:hypothetical protein